MSNKNDESMKAQSGWLLSKLRRFGVSAGGTLITYIVVQGANHFICSHPIFIPEICVYFPTRYMAWLVAFAFYHGIEITFHSLVRKGIARSKDDRVAEVRIKDK